MRAKATDDAAKSPAATTKGAAGSTAYIVPARTGPVMRATWNVIDHRAVSHGSRSAGTMSAGNDRDAGATNARATPKPSAHANSGPTAVGDPPT
jgi:hypothetical protein